MLKENKAYTLHITDEKQLDGLPQTAIEAAAQAARDAQTVRETGVGEHVSVAEDVDAGKACDATGNEGYGWLFTLDMPSYSPFMTYSTQRELRKQMYMARNTVCMHDNGENNLAVCQRLINIRREIAQLLGYETYAD